VLLAADSVLGLFLNFAALHFLQVIDNLALEMAAKGYLTDYMEQEATLAEAARLPKRKSDSILRTFDTILFVGTVAILSVAWGVLFSQQQQ